MTIVFEETGLSPLDLVLDADSPAHYEVVLQKGSTATLRRVTVYKGASGGENAPFDMTKTYKVTVEEEA